MALKPLLSLVVPCYNEQDNVAKVATSYLTLFKKAKIPYELILVDNGSRDNTRKVIKQLQRKERGIRLMVVFVNQGYGHGILTGLRDAHGDIVGWVDGDGQIPPDVVLKAYQTLCQTSFDIAMGRRILRKESWYRTLASKVYNLFFRTLFFVQGFQINSKPKLMRRHVYERFHLISKDWFIDSEILIKARRAHYTIAEIPYTDAQRERGRSTVRFSIVWEFLRNLFRHRFFRL